MGSLDTKMQRLKARVMALRHGSEEISQFLELIPTEVGLISSQAEKEAALEMFRAEQNNAKLKRKRIIRNIDDGKLAHPKRKDPNNQM